MAGGKTKGARGRAKLAAKEVGRRRSAVVLWLVLAVAVLATIWWMREWRKPDTTSAGGSAAEAGYEPTEGARGKGSGSGAGGEGGVSGRRSNQPEEPDVEGEPTVVENSEDRISAPISGDPQERGDGVRLALVIDDFGRSLEEVRQFGALDASISFAVLPFETRTKEVARLLRSLGAETLLHLPMQAKGPQNPGQGALMLTMSNEEVAQATRRALKQVGPVSGVNNHMGSAFSEDGEAMKAVLQVIAEHGLFFLDSRTSKNSLGFKLAREAGVPAAERSVFLDNDASQAEITVQFRRFLAEGRRFGSAIAIGHPYESTRAVLQREVGAAKALGFEFVPVSVLLERSSSEF